MEEKVKIEENTIVNNDELYALELNKTKREMLPYSRWHRQNANVQDKYVKQEYEPKISVVVLAYNNDDDDRLKKCLDSIRNQTYDNLQLCVVDDNSFFDVLGDLIEGIHEVDGEYISFIDSNDYIEPNCLAEFVYFLNENVDIDLMYCDEDKLSEDGSLFFEPFFKPDWSPDTLMSMMYIGNLTLYKREILLRIGNRPLDDNDLWRYDLSFRFMECSSDKKVGHIPMVLYHRRECFDGESKSYNVDNLKKVKEEALARRGIDAKVSFVEGIKQYRINYNIIGSPLVSIIIYSTNNPIALERCIKSINEKTEYSYYEIIVVDNGSFADVKNISSLLNMAVKSSKGEYVLFLDDNIEVVEEKWLDIMLGHALQSHTGAVGAKILYPDNNCIRHIGICNMPIGPRNMLLGLKDGKNYNYGRNKIEYNWLATSGECLLVSKQKFIEVDGFDDELSDVNNDVGLCFKLYKAGYYNVVRQDAILYYHEEGNNVRKNDVGYTNAYEFARFEKERERLYSVNKDLIGKDPFYNKNLSAICTDYSINMQGVGVHNYDVTYEDDLYIPVPTDMCLVIESINKSENVEIKGWAFSDKGLFDLTSNRYLLLRNKAGQVLSIPVEKIPREDLIASVGVECPIEGFECRIDRKIIATNVYEYDIGLLQVDTSGNKDYVWSDKKICQDVVEDINYTYNSRIVSIKNIKPSNINYRIEECINKTKRARGFGECENVLAIKGWAYLENKKSCDHRIELGLINCEENDEVKLYDVIREPRYDVAMSSIRENCYMAGFYCEIPCDAVDNTDAFIVLSSMKECKMYSQEISLNEK